MFDKNGDGTISIDEIGEIFETFDLETSPEQMEKMMKEADIDGQFYHTCIYIFLIPRM